MIASFTLLIAFAVLPQGASAQQMEWVFEDVSDQSTLPVQSLTLDWLGSPHIFTRPGNTPAPGNLTHFFKQDGAWYNETVMETWSLDSIDSAMDALGNLHIVFNALLADSSVHLFYATNAGMPSGQWNVTVLSGNYLYYGAKMASGPGNGVTFCTWDRWTSQTWFIQAAYGQPFVFENVSGSIMYGGPYGLTVSSDGVIHGLFVDSGSHLSEAFKNETGWHNRMIDAQNRTEMGAMSIDQNDRLHVAYICSNFSNYNELIVQYVSCDSSGWGAPLNLVTQRSAWYQKADIDSRGDSRVAIIYAYGDGIYQMNLDHGAVISSSLIVQHSYAVVKLDANYDVRLALRKPVYAELLIQYAYQREIAVPGPPTGLSAENDLVNGNANLTWSPPLNDGNSTITGYAIYRGSSSGGEGGTPIATIDNMTSYIDSTTAIGQTYWYQVSAINSIGEGARSSEASVTVGMLATAPRNLTIFSGLYGLSLFWEAPLSDGGGAPLSYNVYMKIEGMPGDYELKGFGISDLGWSWPFAALGFTYDFKVTCSNSFGEGPASNVASAMLSTLPAAPTLVSATPGEGQIILTWAAPSDDGGHPVTNYTLWRGISPNDEYELVTLGNVLTYADTGLTNGRTYYYRIRATTILGTGIASNELNATPAAAPTVPSAPQDLQAGPESGQVVLTWSIPADNGGSDITSYKVYRGSTTANLVLIGTSVTNQFTDTDVATGSSYAYGVVASNAVGDGPMVTIAGVVIPSPPALFITGIVTDSDGDPLEGAKVSLENGSFVLTDAQGHFNLSALAGDHTLTISHDGMETRTESVTLGSSSEDLGTIELTPTPTDDTWLYIAVGGGAAAVALLLLFFFLLRRRKKEEDGKQEAEKKK